MEDGKKVAVGVGAGLGAWAGASIGIAGFFGAVSGMLPLALLGGYIAHRLHKATSSGEAGKFADGVVKGATKGFSETNGRLAKLRSEAASKRSASIPIAPRKKRPPKP